MVRGEGGSQRLNIVGLGPRGLAVALRALSRGLEVRAWDPTPLRGWSRGEIPDLTMRSPITFDLCTYLDADYSYLHWLGQEYTPITDQRQVEGCTTRATRREFERYLQWCLELALSRGLDLVRERVDVVDSSWAPVVLATGDRVRPRVPDWLWGHQVRGLGHYLRTPARGKRILVLGSGQGAAEAVVYLGRDNQVTWSRGNYRVDPYPVPTLSCWGNRSALGGYYRGLKSDALRVRYLKEVRGWGPSVTPGVVGQLEEVPHKVIPLLTSNQDVPDVDEVVVECGYIPSLGVRLDVEHRGCPHVPNLLDVGAGFQVADGVYVTGPLASYYDGPRQGSLISAGLTAQEIVNSCQTRCS